jgi:hypothetical protein
VLIIRRFVLFAKRKDNILVMNQDQRRIKIPQIARFKMRVSRIMTNIRLRMTRGMLSNRILRMKIVRKRTMSRLILRMGKIKRRVKKRKIKKKRITKKIIIIILLILLTTKVKNQ